MLIKVLRPEALPVSIYSFIEDSMGSSYSQNFHSKESDLTDVFQRSDRLTPIVFILSPGIFELIYCKIDR